MGKMEKRRRRKRKKLSRFSKFLKLLSAPKPRLINPPSGFFFKSKKDYNRKKNSEIVKKEMDET